MNPDPSKLRHQERQEESSALQQSNEARSESREFSSVEELIRHDAAQTPVPGELTERVSESIAREPKRDRPWWRRLFS